MDAVFGVKDRRDARVRNVIRQGGAGAGAGGRSAKTYAAGPTGESDNREINNALEKPLRTSASIRINHISSYNKIISADANNVNAVRYQSLPLECLRHNQPTYYFRMVS